MPNEEAKLISWLYMVEICGDNQASENLKQGVSESLMEMARRTDLEKLTRTYAEAHRASAPIVDWE